MHDWPPPMSTARDNRERFFILTHGRTGSTLLAAILADCGATFGIEAPAQWDASEGDLELPEIQAAAGWLNRAYTISPDKPVLGWRRWIWSTYRARGKRKLRDALAKARYFKCVNLDLAVYEAFKLGYQPSILLSYRRFEESSISDSLNSGNSDLSLFVRRYNRTYRNGLLQVRTFGGCAVGFDQLTDPSDVSWAEPLAHVTGIPAARLVAVRERRVKSFPHAATSDVIDASAKETFDAVDALRGIAVARSAPAVRLTGRPSGRPAATLAAE